MDRFSKLETPNQADKDPEEKRGRGFRSFLKRKLEFKGERRPRPDPAPTPPAADPPQAPAHPSGQTPAANPEGLALEPIAERSPAEIEAERQAAMLEKSRQSLEKYQATTGRVRELERLAQRALWRIVLLVGVLAAVCLFVYLVSDSNGLFNVVLTILGIIFIAIFEAGPNGLSRRLRRRR
jgi:hypothetical protein